MKIDFMTNYNIHNNNCLGSVKSQGGTYPKFDNWNESIINSYIHGFNSYESDSLHLN
jgi:hypothetical protein